MTRLLRDFRIIPVVLVAISALFVLKSAGLILHGGYILNTADDRLVTGTVPPPAGGVAADPLPPRPRSWAQQMFNFPDITGAVDPTAKQEPKAKQEAKGKAAPQEPPAIPAGTPIPLPLDGGRLLSPAERAVLERLAERRAELDERAKELETREAVVLAAEKRLEARVAYLKQLEAQINDKLHAQDESEAARIKNVVTIYENMKAKDAARVFDRLDLRVLVDVATRINPRRMSDILAQMAPEAAERLTVELASRQRGQSPADLPRIEGQPTANSN